MWDVNGVVDGVVCYGVIFGNEKLVGVTPYVESQSSQDVARAAPHELRRGVRFDRDIAHDRIGQVPRDRGKVRGRRVGLGRNLVEQVYAHRVFRVGGACGGNVVGDDIVPREIVWEV